MDFAIDSLKGAREALALAEEALAAGELGWSEEFAEEGLRLVGRACAAGGALEALRAAVRDLSTRGETPVKVVDDKPLVALFGGVGRMEQEYRAAAAAAAARLWYVERRVPRKTPPDVAAVVSHPLREYACWLAADRRLSVTYLRTPSVSAVRAAFAQMNLRHV